MNTEIFHQNHTRISKGKNCKKVSYEEFRGKFVDNYTKNVSSDDFPPKIGNTETKNMDKIPIKTPKYSLGMALEYRYGMYRFSKVPQAECRVLRRCDHKPLRMVSARVRQLLVMAYRITKLTINFEKAWKLITEISYTFLCIFYWRYFLEIFFNFF